MRIIIHRGTHAIGGSCIEIASGGHRIILDLGLPLMGRDGAAIDEQTLKSRSRENGILPNVAGLYNDQEPTVDAALLSHAHIDHHGLLGHVHPNIQIYMSKGSKRLIEIGNIFYPEKTHISNAQHFEHWKPFKVGPFNITSYLMDHSAFDASAFLIECEGEKVFYTGDLRAHGRKGIVFENLISHPIPKLDCLIMEGTTLGGEHKGCANEQEVEEQFEQAFKQQKDMSFIFTSGSNIDRLVSLYVASLRSRKTLVIDLYTAYVLDQLKNLRPTLPPYDNDNVRVYFMSGHAERLVDNDLKEILYKFKPRKIEIDEIVKNRINMVIKLPIWNGMGRIAEAASKESSLHEAQLIYSMWQGYLEKKSDVKDFCSTYGIGMKYIHTSGHAYLKDLQRLVHALNPSALIPVHTLTGDAFSKYFPNVVRLDDGVAYELNSQSTGC